MSLEKTILFPINEKTSLVRVFKNDKSDFEALARCFNSFKDSNSWPDGFGGSFVFTGEFLQERFSTKDLTTHFVANDPNDGQKIIGVCFCNPTWNLPDSYYVGLLGVDPLYQKQKFGKNLLLRATEFAMERKLRLIGLHTWPGNLKAMPTYKRQGYKWRPNTTVFMENYIPQILNFSFFTDLFTKHVWYDVYKPIITQEPNLEFEEEMAIYNYFFEMDENTSLKVWIDRTVGYISGFHKKTESNDLIIKANTRKSEAYIGIEEFSVELFISNRGFSKKSFKINVKPTNNIDLIIKNVSENFILEPQEEKTIQVRGRFLVNTPELDMKVHTHTYCNHHITFIVKVDGAEFPLTVGKVPRNAINVNISPLNFVTLPDHDGTISLNFVNITGSGKQVNFEIKDGNNVTFGKHQYKLNVNHYDSAINIPYKTSNTNSTTDYFKINVKTNEDTIIQDKKIPIVIFKEDKALSYEYNDQIFIENKAMRVSFYKNPQPGDNELIIIDKVKGLTIKGHPIILGYPFDEEGSEFYSKTLIHELKESDEGIWLLSSAESNQKKGVNVIRKILIPNENLPFFVYYTVENNRDQSIENLGIQVVSYWWPGEFPVLRHVQSLSEGIVQNFLHELAMDMGRDSKVYSEGWKAIEYTHGTIGVLFEPEKIDKIHIGRNFPNIEYKLPTIISKQTYDTPKVWYCFTDKWQTVRKIWQDMFQPSPKNKFKLHSPVRIMKRIGLLSGEEIVKGIITDRARPDLSVAIDSYKKTTFKGKMELDIEEKPSLNFDLKGENKKLWIEKANIPFNNERLINGIITFDSLTRIYRFPISIGFFDSNKSISIRQITSEKEDYVEMDNGFLKIRGSADYRGQIFYLSIDGSQNYLLTHYPEVKPFLWFNKFFGGISGIIREEGTWDQTKYNELKFKQVDIPDKGSWKGIGFESDIINYSPKLKGLQVKNLYFTLPDSPFILVQQEVTNHSGVERVFESNVESTIFPSNSTKDRYYTTSHNQVIEFKTQDFESLVWLHKDKDARWAAYKKDGNEFYYSMILDKYSDYDDQIWLYVPNLTFSEIGCSIRSVTIQPNESLTFNVLIVVSKSLKTFEPFIENNISELFNLD